MAKKTAVLDAAQQGQVIGNHEPIINDEDRTFRGMMPGDTQAQGDVYIVMLRSLPQSAKERADRQMAEGVTQGSRHILQGGCVYSADPAEVIAMIEEVCPATKGKITPNLIGPVFSGPASLLHPEHGNHVYEDEGAYATVYQQNWVRQQAMRVRD